MKYSNDVSSDRFAAEVTAPVSHTQAYKTTTLFETLKITVS